VAVAYADMVGYSRLIELDDAGTLQRLRTLRREVIDPAITEHGGRVVQTGGDSLLIVFDSIDGAVRCAVTVQQQVPILDAAQPSDRIMRFRIGINLGDAIADGTDLHGDAVNVAARLQAECPPGGICVSRSVRDHVHGRLDLTFEELGALSLKNIARPVEAFAVKHDGTVPPTHLPNHMSHNFQGQGKPCIAVLAFSNFSGDLDQEYFSDGIAHDIITELSRKRTLLVRARNWSFAYKGGSLDIRQIAQELAVQYILAGSVRRSGERLRVTAELIEGETGNNLWAERYDRRESDLFAVQDEIALAVARAILPAVTDAEQQRVLRRAPESLGAWEAYQRGLWYRSRLRLEDVAKARQWFERAAILDPEFALPHTALADLVVLEITYFGSRPFSDLELVATEARMALELDPRDADAHAVVARSLANAGDFSSAFDHIDRALAITPDHAGALRMKGVMLIYNNRFSEGRQLLLSSIKADPNDPFTSMAFSYLGMSYYFERAYEAAVSSFREALGRRPNHLVSLRWLAASLGQLGRRREAHEVLQNVIAIAPDSFAQYTRERAPNMQQGNYEHMLDGLRKAGWRG
jgi:TolB-like protein/class 3 adenylate cyclase/Tfp pilus assembly protein PilF